MDSSRAPPLIRQSFARHLAALLRRRLVRCRAFSFLNIFDDSSRPPKSTEAKENDIE